MGTLGKRRLEKSEAIPIVDENIIIRGARVNNLKDISLDIPRNKFTVITGISGSGKSSLAFDTLFAEGQRRFAESLSSYARQFLGRMSKPDVDKIEGIPPAIAIEQKITTRNPRSTVATTTEIYDYLRLIFARIGKTYSPISGFQVHSDTVNDVIRYVEALFAADTQAKPVLILSEIGWLSREDKTELLLQLKEEGYNRLYTDGKPKRIDEVLSSGVDNVNEAYLLLDRFSDLSDRDRLLSSLSDAFSRGGGEMYVLSEVGMKRFCNRFEADGTQFSLPDEYMFSFNSPLGACPTCGGLGQIIGISEDLVVPDKTKSLYDGAIACWRGEKMAWFRDQLIRVAAKYDIPIFEPYCKLSDKVRRLIWEGDRLKSRTTNNKVELSSVSFDSQGASLYGDSFVGINEFFEWVDSQKYKIQYKYMLSRFSGKAVCYACQGTRLRQEALYVKVVGKTIAEVLAMTCQQALDYFRNLPASLEDWEQEIIAEPLKEIISRLECVVDVGLSYLSLNRSCNTLSGGESQRINLVTALGSSLVGSMYILDEPSVGLHPRDTERLISVLKRLRDIGNTVIVVEHDEEIIRSADLVIDMGPKAGVYGGEMVYCGSIPSVGDEITSSEKAKLGEGKSLTIDYLMGLRPKYKRQLRPWQYSITIKGAMEHNLKDIDVRFPLGVLCLVTGVSGSGKSSLVGDILYPALYRHINEAGDQPGVFRGMSGNVDRISRVEYVDQNPIGRSSRSNAVTYLKAFEDIRRLFAQQHYAKINGFGPNYFSFNSDGGRCPECQGEGIVRIEMQFMSDVSMVCEECGGKRYKSEVLEVKYRGKSISDVLNMKVDEAIEFFSEGKEPEAAAVVRKLKPLQDVGLGYIGLGQSSSTLSGGESQRVKLAYFLSLSMNKAKSEKIMFIFDEPTTGLHFYDVEKLLKSFDALLVAGHSLVVVEHNPDVIRNADWIIDLGPDAGENGGRVVFEGRPEDLIKSQESCTAAYI